MDSCRFENCFASKEGGAIQHGIGTLTVANSTFYGNSAGAQNVEGGETKTYVQREEGARGG